MPTFIRDRATEAANEVLAEHWNGVLPVDPAKIARAMSIEVTDAYLDPDVAGAIEKRAGRSARILLNATEGANRKRFTCAHEIGHFYKHQAEGEGDFEYIDYRDGASTMGRDSDERFANAFAAALLMPEEHVRARRDTGTSEHDLARQFNVSHVAMVNRLKNLGLYR